MTQPADPSVVFDDPSKQFAERSGGQVVFDDPVAQFKQRTLEGKPKPPPSAAGVDQSGLGAAPGQEFADASAARAAEQARLEAEHGRIATIALQGAKGVLDGLTAPGALIGVNAQAIGALTGSKALEDFGRGLGDASTGASAMQALAFGFSDDSADKQKFDAFDKTKEVIEGQQKAWPTLSTVSNIAGRVAFAVGTGSLASAGETGVAETGTGLLGTARAGLAQGTAALGKVGTQAAMGAVEGGAMGAQAAYEKQAPLRDVITSTLLGAAMGGGTAALPALVKTDKARELLEDFSNERTFKAIGGTSAQATKMAQRYGIAEEKIGQISDLLHETKLEDGEPVFKGFWKNPGDHLERITQAREEIGAKLGALRSSADEVIQTHPEIAPDAAKIADQIEQQVVAPLKKYKLTSGQASSAQVFADDVRALAEEGSTASTVKKLYEYRSKLDDRIYPLRDSVEQNIMGAKEALEPMEKARNLIEDAIGDSTQKAADMMKSDAVYDTLKNQYNGLSLAQKIAAKASAKQVGQRVMSGSDTLVGGAVLAGGVASGNPLAVLKGLAAATMHKALREKSSGLLAVISRRLASGGEEAAGEALTAGAEGAEQEGLRGSAGGILESGLASTQKFSTRKAESAFGEKLVESPFEVGHHVAQEHVTEKIIHRSELASNAPDIPVHVAGGRENQQVLRTLASAQNQSRQMEQAAGPNPDQRQMARQNARNQTATALVNEAGHYDPASWATQPPTPLQRVVYRSALLDHMAPELSQSIASLPLASDFSISIDHVAKLARDANGPQAIGTLQQALETLLQQTPATADGDAVAYAMRQTRAALSRADVPTAMDLGHQINQQLVAMAAQAQDPTARDYAQRSSAAVRDALSSPAFGSAGTAYRTATAGVDRGQTENLEDPAVMRNVLRSAASRGILTKPLNDQKRMALGAALAQEQLSGQHGLTKQTEAGYKDALDKAAKAENAVTLDGGPMGHVFDYFHSQIDNRVAANLGDDLTQVTARAVRPEVSRVLPALRRQAPNASMRVDRPAPMSRGQQIQQYQDRLDALHQFSSDPNAGYIQAGMKVFHGVTDDLQNAVGQDMGAKMQQLAADLPKPQHTLRGPAYDSLSSEDLRLANAMWEATTDPMSMFADFERGHVDYNKVKYAQKQYPGLALANQAGLMDMLTEHLSDSERSGIPDYVLTQVDHLFGLGGRLQSTSAPEFSAHITAMMQQQQQQNQPQQGGDLELPHTQSLTERLTQGRKG